MKKAITILFCFALIFSIQPKGFAETSYIIEPKYKDVRPFHNGFAWVKLSDGFWRVINKEGEILSPGKYFMDFYVTGWFNFEEGLSRAFGQNGWVFIDENGQEVIQTDYENVVNFSEGFAGFQKNGKWGFIDKTGKVVVPPIYDSIENTFGADNNRGNIGFKNGLAGVQKNGNWGYIDKTGKEVIAPQYGYALPFYEGLARVEKNGKWGFINQKGQEVIKLKYDEASDFSNGLASVGANAKMGFVNKSGQEVIKLQYPVVLPFSEGLAPFGDWGKFGFLNTSGKVVVTPKYSSVYDFQDGVARVEVYSNNITKYGLIDKTGKELIQPQTSVIDDFQEGFGEMRIKSGDKWGRVFIDTTGKIVTPFYEDAKEFSEGLGAVKENGKWGFIAKPGDTPSDWAKKEVDEAIALNLVPKGMQYGYTQNITRADFSKLVTHFLQTKTGKTADELLKQHGATLDKGTFLDTTDQDILVANALGIVNGKGNGKFDPDGLLTREEAATMLMRTAGFIGLNVDSTAVNFADQGQISNWAIDSVAFVSSTKDVTNNALVMGGTGHQKFSPKTTYTKQQAFITMKRLFQAN